MLKKCKWCGTEFSPVRSQQLYCDRECSRQAKVKWQQEYEAKKREEREKKPKQKPEKKKIGLVEIEREARAAGMSYGKYSAMQELKKERKLHGERKNNRV